MPSFTRIRPLILLAPAAAALLFVQAPSAQTAQRPPSYPALPSETPASFEPVTASFGYVKRDVMIPMRDGVKLHTVILVPKGARRAPILLTRTPYDATGLTTHAQSAHLGSILYGYDNATDVIVEGGYIRAVQDVRGKHGSEGDYVMNRPLHGPQNPTPIDHATDTYDTIDWLVKNVAETNGKVGILGISYDGFLPLMALVNPHPALKVSVPMNPMVDGWIGDDWFHNGAFRQQMMAYIHDQEATRESDTKWWTSHYDDYDMFMQAGSAGELGRQRGLEQVGFWRKLLEHPAYDAFWRDQAVDKILASQPLTVPVMVVHSLWDQEDIYGAIAVYKAIEPKDTGNDKVFLVMGPWHHGQEIGDGSTLGALKFNSDTALSFRQDVLRPFLDHFLKDDAPAMDVAPVTAFETGSNAWRRLPAWPAGCATGCTIAPTPLYLTTGLKTGFAAPAPGAAPFDEYVSDPSKPVPFRSRPIQPVGGSSWARWLVDDQREASGRPDVLAFVSDQLTTPLKISGQPIANLVASTSGTDSDWVVKLIDVYPDEVAGQPALGGYQLMVSADIFRGRYRESLDAPRPIASDRPLPYRFNLPTANHVFLPGHRVMVQVQSSWFPLYDRNPQTFVPSIFRATPADFRKATQRIYHAPAQASFIELPVVSPQRSAERASGQDPWFSTFSIIAFDPATNALGVAVQSRAFAAGAAVPYAKPGVGAVATQAAANRLYGPKAIALLEQGLSPADVVKRITDEDPGRDTRQVAVIDTKGRSAVYTGKHVIERNFDPKDLVHFGGYAGHLSGKNFSVQGNTLASEAVVKAMADAYEHGAGSMAERMMDALDAGQSKGGDTRGMQSAGILVVRPIPPGSESTVERIVDIRVDDAPNPFVELRRLLNITLRR